MDRTAHTERGRHWKLRVASGVLFAAAFVGLFLPWADRPGTYFDPGSGRRSGLDIFVLDISLSEIVRHPDWPRLAGLVVLVALPVVGFTLSIRSTRRSAVARAILAAIGTAPLVFAICFSFAWTGRPPDIVGGWVTFWAFVGAFVVNVIAARAGTDSIAGNAGPKARTPLGVGGS